MSCNDDFEGGKMKYLKYLLIFVPISIIGHWIEFSDSIVFLTSCLAIIPLAGFLGEATEELAVYTGPKLGGFLNATFGNATELIIAFFAMKAGLFDVVKASLAGSVLGNILLVLGVSIFAGGLKHKDLFFDKEQGSFTSTMLLFSLIGLSLPAVFAFSIPESVLGLKYEKFSLLIALILLIIYVIGLIYSFRTQKDVYGVEHAADMDSRWSKKTSIFVLALCTIFIALESEMLVKTIEPMTAALGIKKMFVGLILIPIIGNAAEHSTAVVMALKNKMDIAIEIAVGSSLQISLFVAPLLVLLSHFYKPMSIVFLPIEIFVFASSVLIANKIVSSGKTNWLEGLLLIAVYFIAAIGFFVL